MDNKEYEKQHERVTKYQKTTETIEECKKSIKKIEGYTDPIKFYVGRTQATSVDSIRGFEEFDDEKVKGIVLEMLYEKIEKLNIELDNL